MRKPDKRLVSGVSVRAKSHMIKQGYYSCWHLIINFMKLVPNTLYSSQETH